MLFNKEESRGEVLGVEIAGSLPLEGETLATVAFEVTDAVLVKAFLKKYTIYG